MRIKAKESIIEWDAGAGRIAVLNAGTVEEVSDEFGERMVESGRATKSKAKLGDPGADEAAEVAPAEPEAAPAEDDAGADAAPAVTGSEGEAPVE